MKPLSFKALGLAAALVTTLISFSTEAQARCETTSRSMPQISRVDRNLTYFGVLPIQFSATPPTIKGDFYDHCREPWHNVLELRINGRLVATAHSYYGRNIFNWNTAEVPDGEHTIEVRSKDSDYGYDYSYARLRIRVNNTDVRKEVFDLAAYLKFNPEVAAAYPGNPTSQVQHWLNFGINEGRRSSFFFHSRQYLEAYPDLTAAFGPGNFSAAIRHYLTYGIKEGRGGVHALRKEVFDPRFYLKKHADVARSVGADNIEGARLHWMAYGLKEGRASSANFSVKNYLARYADLRRAYKTDYEAAVRHYSIYGIREKRSGK